MIVINHLTKKYKERLILDSISINISDEGVTFILGKNGSGKSTFIKCLLSLESYKGDIAFDGNSYIHDSKLVFAVFDDSALYDNLTGVQNLIILTQKKVEDIVEKSEGYLSESLLWKKSKSYSHGERKKIFLIAVELIRPRFIIMDEVSSGLDYETLLHLKKRIKVWSEHSTVILTGHQFDFYRSIIDELIILKENKMTYVEYDGSKTLENIYGDI